MADFQFQEMFPHGEDRTPYRRIEGDWVSADTFRGESILLVDPAALTRLAAEAVRDVSHLFRPGHLGQLRRILDDPEASPNDRFVALNMLRNACVSAGMILPSCQDTGTAIAIGKKGQCVWTPGNDEEAIALMRDTRFGLTASVWTDDTDRAERVARELDVGTVFQNRCDYVDPSLPWSGWGESGRGATMSRYGFLALTRRKALHFRQAP